jgi:mannose/fructose/N-acetylgalactosamine-specific phosphotransferase system component IIB
MSWLLHRIDDRLIHGQVLVAWGARLHPARMWVVDDEVAASDWERQAYSDAAPGVDVRVARVAEAAAEHAAEGAAPAGAFLLVRDLATARRLVEAGAVVGAFNVGGLHFAPGKSKVCEYVYLDDADRADARALLARGVALEVRDVPASKPQPLESLDPGVRP